VRAAAAAAIARFVNRAGALGAKRFLITSITDWKKWGRRVDVRAK
jgi:hypothetical protein